jgi:DNA-binding LytR/AlgR family response regulator
MTLRCAVIDDEPLARQGVVDFVRQVPALRLVGEWGDPAEAAVRLATDPVDLLFLDMRMPRMNGLDLLRALPHKPATIVISAHTEHALESYELEVIDYILKPFPFERFVKAVNRAVEFLELNARAQGGPLRNEDHFFVRSEGRYVKVRFEEVLFVQAMQNYVIIRTAGGQHICHLTFSSIEDHLPSDRFLRVHKSYIVATAHVEAIETDGLRIGGNVIPVSRSEREAILARIMDGRLLRR